MVLQWALLVQIAVIVALTWALLRRRSPAPETKTKEPAATKAAAAEPLDPLRLPALAELVATRAPYEPDARNVLPAPGFSIDDALERRVEAPEGEDPGKSRRHFPAHRDNLRRRLAGQSELVLLNALAISYLRRRTPHERRAREVFFRIWDEAGDRLAEQINTRWLISTLTTFGDHGRTEAERTNGALGYVYGSLIIGHELDRTHIAAEPGPLAHRFEPDFSRYDIAGTQPFDMINSNHLQTINAFCYQRAMSDRLTGRLLERLMEKAAASDTLFSRTDALRAEDAASVSPVARQIYWSFGAPRDG